MFAGPENYFRIVIDDFDGKLVKAWHFEDADGNRSPNLASFAKGHNIDLLANLDVHLFLVAVHDAARTYCNDLGDLRFFLCSSGKDDTALGGLFSFYHFQYDSVK